MQPIVQRSFGSVTILGILALTILLTLVSTAEVRADGDPIKECDGDYVWIEKTDSEGNSYSAYECDPQEGSDWWKWALGLVGLGGVTAYSWNMRNGRGSTSAGGNDSRL